MDGRTIYITELDRERLHTLIDDAKRLDRHGSAYMEQVEIELARAILVAPSDVPADVVTMNSKVCLKDLDTGEEMIVTLVFPRDADIAQSKVSVFAPIGTAMLGYQVGDTFTWPVPDGVRQLQIEGILYQPEAAGDDHL